MLDIVVFNIFHANNCTVHFNFVVAACIAYILNEMKIEMKWMCGI